MLVDSNTRFHKLHQSKTKQVGEETGSDPERTSKTALVGGSYEIHLIIIQTRGICQGMK